MKIYRLFEPYTSEEFDTGYFVSMERAKNYIFSKPEYEKNRQYFWLDIVELDNPEYKRTTFVFSWVSRDFETPEEALRLQNWDEND